MLPTCSDDSLQYLTAAISDQTSIDADRKSLILAIKKLKRFLSTDGKKLIEVISRSNANVERVVFFSFSFNMS